METNAKPKSAKSLQYYMRTLHRVLGFLAVGLVIVYSLSGIILIHRTGDMMKRSVAVEQTIAPGLDASQLAGELKMKNFKAESESDELITFKDGEYNRVTGELSYVKKEVVWPFNKMVDLHKMPEAKNRHIAWFTTTFGIVLFLLAATSLFMYKAKSKQFKTNMIYVAFGVVLAALLVAIV